MQNKVDDILGLTAVSWSFQTNRTSQHNLPQCCHYFLASSSTLRTLFAKSDLTTSFIKNLLIPMDRLQ